MRKLSLPFLYNISSLVNDRQAVAEQNITEQKKYFSLVQSTSSSYAVQIQGYISVCVIMVDAYTIIITHRNKYLRTGNSRRRRKYEITSAEHCLLHILIPYDKRLIKLLYNLFIVPVHCIYLMSFFVVFFVFEIYFVFRKFLNQLLPTCFISIFRKEGDFSLPIPS